MGKILQLKITLKGIRPPIWRRVLVKEDITFYRLHRIIQAAMGWEEYHLYKFEVGDFTVIDKDPDFKDYGPVKRPRSKVSAFDLVAGERFTYDYDFGDDWEHEIIVERVLEEEPGQIYPRCIAGKRCCPPEDVGGIPGYMNLLDILSNPKDEEYENMMEWARRPSGEAYDPEYFDIEETNWFLKQLK